MEECMHANAHSEKDESIALRSNLFPPALRVGFWLCIAIAVAAVLRRLAALAHPSQSGPPLMANLDAVFQSHTALTLAHILPALAFVLLLPFTYFRRFSHAVWLQQAIFFLGSIVGVTAYAMSSYSVGGWIERSAVLFFNTLFLFSLICAWLYLQRGEFLLKQQWLTRAIAILLGIATTRPVMGIFFATSPLTHLTPSQFFGLAFWIGFSINTITVELWLRSRKNQFLPAV
jgi:hypothetical protein